MNTTPSLIVGVPARTGKVLEVRNPWSGALCGAVEMVDRTHIETAIQAALSRENTPLNRYQRSVILRKAAVLLAERREEFARVMTAETGLCIRETRYETGRTLDVLEFAAIEALRDDGQIFSCDISPAGKDRKIFTFRQPAQLAFAITPFNHPLNQVAHKVAPAVAAGVPMLLKPSEKTPLTALLFTGVMYQAGLPPWMLSTFLGDLDEVVSPLLSDERVDRVSFTGSVEIGKIILRSAGYKRCCLELGGNSPLIVMADADMDLAVTLAAEGSYRNSGQRCTAVKRILVEESICDEFTDRLVEKTAEYVCGDPSDEQTRVGTVINEAAAIVLEERVKQAVEDGAVLRCGGSRRGALMEPTVVAGVPRTTPLVDLESFGPIAPVIPVAGLDDAIAYYNSGRFGLSSAIVTRNLEHAMRAAKELRTGTTNINEVPGYRIESSPFGGIKDSGLGVKEGVIEAVRFYTDLKTFSLPW